MKKIGTRMICLIMPIILLAMILLVGVSYISSKTIIQDEMQAQMDSKLQEQMSNIDGQIEAVTTIASATAVSIGNIYKSVSLNEIENLLKAQVLSNGMVTGGGVWFEPYVYDQSQKYEGPYAVREGNAARITYEYSNEGYDYFKYPWYADAKSSQKTSFTDPYYDKILDATVSTCSVPIFDNNNTFVGIITVDIDLSSIQNMVADIADTNIGEAMLLSKEGLYLSNADESKNMSQNIQEEEISSLSEAGKKILDTKKGAVSYSENGQKYNLYYDNIDRFDWILVNKVSESELMAPVKALISKLIMVSVISIVLAMVAVLAQVAYLSKNIKKVNAFALNLSKGDFTIEPLVVKSKDEIGQMGQSMNEMFFSNKEIIQTIRHHAEGIADSSERLEESAQRLAGEFNQIEEIIKNVNEDMMSTSASTEEVSASAENVNSLVSVLAEETIRSAAMADEIKKRAAKIQSTSEDSVDRALSLTGSYREKIEESIENAKVVAAVNDLAQAISEIAEQINLLSLNASIEAARAGEQGKGFAVVAGEIGKLANQTTSAVDKIKNTTAQIESAFTNLLDNSKGLLGFVTDTVTPDYRDFVDVSKKYGDDAMKLEDISQKIAEMTESIEKIVGEVTEAVSSIAESSQNTATNGSQIMENVNHVSSVVNQLAEMVKSNENTSLELNKVVNHFRL